MRGTNFLLDEAGKPLSALCLQSAIDAAECVLPTRPNAQLPDDKPGLRSVDMGADRMGVDFAAAHRAWHSQVGFPCILKLKRILNSLPRSSPVVQSAARFHHASPRRP